MKQWMRLVCVEIVALFVSISWVYGADYYVSPLGKDTNPGSQTSPWKTIHHAISELNGKAAESNLTLYVTSGTYRVNSGQESDERLVISRSMKIIGSSDTIIDGTGANQWKFGLEIEASNVTIQQIRIKGFQSSNGGGILLLSGTGIIIEQSQIFNNFVGIIIRQGSQQNEIRNGCSIYQNIFAGLVIDGSIGNQIFGNQSGFYDNGRADSGGSGIQLINGASLNSIMLNHIYFTGNSSFKQSVGVYLLGAGSENKISLNSIYGHSFVNAVPNANHNGLGIQVVDSSPLIEQNFIIDNHKGIFVSSGTNGKSSPIIQNNQIYKNAASGQNWGIYLLNNGGQVSSWIYHNTIDGGNNSGIEIVGASAIIKYNIITNFKYGIQSDTANITLDYNNVWNNSLSNYAGCSAGPHDISVNPKYVGSSDYTLMQDSPCIDAIPLTEADPVSIDLSGYPRPRGNGFDMGCFETSASNQYILNVQRLPAEGGTVSDSLNLLTCSGNICTAKYSQNASVTLTATPSSGFTFQRWEGDISGSSNPITVSINSNKTVKAVFSTNYNLSIQIIGNGTVSANGVICSNNCSYSVTSGTSVTITASPGQGYKFARWEGDIDGNGTSTAITMTSNKTIRAIFIQTYSLTVAVTPSGKGTVSINDVICDGTCSRTFDQEASVTLKATASNGYIFEQWQGSISGSVNPYVIKMDSTKSVTAIFSPGYQLSVSVTGSGTVTAKGIQCPTDCSESFKTGEKVVITAVPSEGFRFDRWEGDLTGTSSTSEIVMTGNRSVRAFFVKILKVTLTISMPTGGSVESEGIACPVYCGKDYVLDAVVKLTATPQAGYRFDRWEGDATGTNNPLTIIMNSNKTVTPVFVPEIRQATLTISIQPSGSGTVTGTGINCPPDCSETINIGSSVQLTAVPSLDYQFNYWKNTTVDFVNPKLVDIRTDQEIQAVFARKDNQPPNKPVVVRPANESIFQTGPVTLLINPFSDPEGDRHLQTLWMIRRIDRTYGLPEYDPSFTATVNSGKLTEHTVSGLYPGLKYAWKVGVVDSGSLKTSWVDKEYIFKIGNPETDSAIQIPKGVATKDYRMASVCMWLNDPSSLRVFENALKGYYHRDYFRIGTYDPISGAYIEYGTTMKVEPGKAFWVLARNGMNLSVTGIPVSLSHDMDVELSYQPLTGNGWNMIACPNKAQYLWKNIQVIAYHPDGTVKFGPTPVSELADNNPFIDKRLWRWENGSYLSDTAVMQPYIGYWVKSRAASVYLRFPVSAQNKLAHDALFTVQDLKLKLKQAIHGISPNIAIAEVDYPPMPMDAFSDADSKAGDANANCMIDTIFENKN